MSAAKLTIAILLAAVLGVPFLLRPPTQGRSHDADSLKLVIVTPHVQQIRSEFGAAFDTWYFSRTGQHVMVDWRTPGGTSEIVRQLQSVYIAAIKNGRFETDDAGNIVFPAGSVEVPDLFFGGHRPGFRCTGLLGENTTPKQARDDILHLFPVRLQIGLRA